MSLTPKQQRFVDEYLIDLNATQAAIRAGYAPKAAYATGHENLKKPQIASEIARRQDVRSQQVGVTAEMVLDGLLGEAKATGEGTSHAARVAAWTQLGKHLGMFRDKVEHSGTTTVTHVYLPQKQS
jgi:phage terminase small subunit